MFCFVLFCILRKFRACSSCELIFLSQQKSIVTVAVAVAVMTAVVLLRIEPTRCNRCALVCIAAMY